MHPVSCTNYSTLCIKILSSRLMNIQGTFPPFHCFYSVFCLDSVVPQTTVILNNDRQNSIVAKMVGQEEPLNRAADSLENILSKLVTLVLPPLPSYVSSSHSISRRKVILQQERDTF